MAKLVDAMHILNSEMMSDRKLRKANRLLISFVDEFQDLYGAENMVYNVHQLRHLGECVLRNGPLFTYSNYPMEDFIGHLVSLVKGTTDVTTQICSRYLLEKNLHFHLQKSQLARGYYDRIESKLFFPIAQRVNGSLVIGKAKWKSDLTIRESSFVRNALHIDDNTDIHEYRAAFLNGSTFYETFNNNSKKRTNDSIVYDSQSKSFGEIVAILVVDENMFFLIHEKFKKISDRNCKYIHFLEETSSYRLKLMKPEQITDKCACVQFANTIAASLFPNLHERN